jgi:large subunit ribosomal protein L7A
MLSQLKTQPKVVGAKQVRRALKEGRASRVFLAVNADPQLTDPIRAQCAQQGVPTEEESSMRELGRACGIAVDAAVAALLR